MATILAFDFGLQRTGVAVGNTFTGTASPECTLQSRNDQPNWDAITQLLEKWEPDKLLVGLPIALEGEDENPIVKRITKFCNQLNGRYNLPVETENEQYTSIEAADRLKQLRQSGRKQKVTKEDVDMIAASIILENWMLANGHR